jgi:hypothetical protein
MTISKPQQSCLKISKDTTNRLLSNWISNIRIQSGIVPLFVILSLFVSSDQPETYDNVYQFDLLCPVLLRRRQDNRDQLPLV